MKIRLFAFFAMMFVSCSLLAVCPVQKATIFFINGIDTVKSDAIKTKNRIERELKTQPGYNPECVTIKLAYNQTEGVLADFAEAHRQKILEEKLTPTNFWQMFERLTPAKDWFVNGFVTAMSTTQVYYDSRDAKILAQINEHLAMYRAEPATNRIILFSHSQGNFFGNEEYQAALPEERERMKIVSVATPSSLVAGGGPYTTLEEDKLITSRFLAGALLWNITNHQTCTDDFICHGIETAYLVEGTPSREKILADIMASLPTVQNGVVVEGHIFLWPDNVPSHGAMVHIFCPRPEPSGTSYNTITDTSGFYRFPSVLPDAGCFIEATDQWNSWKNFDVPSQGTVDIDIILSPIWSM